LFNQLFTMPHTMIFFVAKARSFWFRQLPRSADDGARDIAFPRLNASSFCSPVLRFLL